MLWLSPSDCLRIVSLYIRMWGIVNGRMWRSILNVNEFFPTVSFTTPRLTRLIQYLMLHGHGNWEKIAPEAIANGRCVSHSRVKHKWMCMIINWVNSTLRWIRRNPLSLAIARTCRSSSFVCITRPRIYSRYSNNVLSQEIPICNFDFECEVSDNLQYLLKVVIELGKEEECTVFF